MDHRRIDKIGAIILIILSFILYQVPAVGQHTISGFFFYCASMLIGVLGILFLVDIYLKK